MNKLYEFVRNETFLKKAFVAVCVTLSLGVTAAQAYESPETVSYAQAQKQVSGTVLDENGAPIPGASVTVEGTTLGVSTDAQGKYTLSVPEGSELTFSFIGYDTQVIPVGARSVIDVNLKPESVKVDEVVVMAYGTQKKKNLTAAAVSVKGDELVKSPVASLDQAMQGKLSGVMISSASGTPGGAINVNIRGTNSISAGNDPLYVVDGVPVVPTDNSQKSFGGQKLSPIADLNPNDIQNIQVLKDASASALYGSRASNGVILITTKRGNAQRTKVTLDSYVGIQDLWRNLDFLDAPQWIGAMNEAVNNYNTSLGLQPGMGGYKKEVKALVEGANTDWMKEIQRSTAMQTSHQLSIAGGNERTQFYISGGYYYQEGIVKRNQYDRMNLRTNIDHQVNKRLKVRANLALSRSDNDRIWGDNNIYGAWLQSMRARPDQPIHNADGTYYPSKINNPVQLMKEPNANTKIYRGIIGLQTELMIIDGLYWRMNLGGDYAYMNESIFQPSTSKQGAATDGKGEDYRTFSVNNLIENTVTYDHSWNKFNLTALLGYSFQKTIINQSNLIGTNFPSDQLQLIGSASTITQGQVKEKSNALQSVFGKVGFGYDDRYLAEFSLRSDASSKFAKGKRVGYFPAGSVGWRISKESFFPQNKVLTDVKIRASVGQTGNQEGIPFYDFYDVYKAGVNYDGYPGLAPGLPDASYSRISNPDLTWEKTLQTDIGLDLEFLNGRVEFTFDWFKQKTTDLLLTHNINGISGYSKMTSNVGSVENKGYEFQVFSYNLTGAFKWNTSFNISFIKNKVTAMNRNASGEYVGMNQGTAGRLEVGHPIGAFYLVKMLGIYQSKEEILAEKHGQKLWDSGIRPGDVKYEDLNGDGLYNEGDKQFIGNPYPKFYGGLYNNFSYKNFDLSIGLQFSYGNDLYCYWKEKDAAGHMGAVDNAIFKDEWDNRWREDRPNNDTPRAVASGTAATHNRIARTSRYLQDASYLRIKALTFGYTLPQRITRKVLVENCRVYFTANNLWTFTKYDGFDPEVDSAPGLAASRGVDFATIPQLRSFVFGINLTF